MKPLRKQSARGREKKNLIVQLSSLVGLLLVTSHSRATFEVTCEDLLDLWRVKEEICKRRFAKQKSAAASAEFFIYFWCLQGPALEKISQSLLTNSGLFCVKVLGQEPQKVKNWAPFSAHQEYECELNKAFCPFSPIPSRVCSTWQNATAEVATLHFSLTENRENEMLQGRSLGFVSLRIPNVSRRQNLFVLSEQMDSAGRSRRCYNLISLVGSGISAASLVCSQCRCLPTILSVQIFMRIPQRKWT